MSWLHRMTPSRGPSRLAVPLSPPSATPAPGTCDSSSMSSSESPGQPRTTGNPLWEQWRSTRTTYATLSIVLKLL